MNMMSTFRSKISKLPAEAAAKPARFGKGTRLLFSCGSRSILPALADAEAHGLDARGVGRMHILIEVEDTTPDAHWVATAGKEIADYFERIGGTQPQINIDRNFS